ncbi:MAG: hypothetical protein Q8P15_00835 [Nanoarchaeota archaeon]|nr:hypothetical protein [Nanoarchaeota archaeon]
MTDKDYSEIEKICRLYAVVVSGEGPYDARLSKVKGEIENSYKTVQTAYGDKKSSEIDSINAELKRISGDSNGIFSKIKSAMNKGGLESIFELGDSLVKSKSELEKLQLNVNKSYDVVSRGVYTIFQGIIETKKLLKDYQETLDESEKEIKSLHEEHSDDEKLRQNINLLIENKSKSEGVKIEKEERKKVSMHLIAEGEKRLRELSEKFLKTRENIRISREFSSYEVFVEKYNQVAESLGVVREKLDEDISKIKGVLMVYEIISRPEIKYLREINIPERYIDAINELVLGIEKIDEQFSDKVLREFLSGRKSKKVNDVALGEIVPELVAYVRENGNGTK